MRINIQESNWQAELTTFNERNEQRPTRLEVLGRGREAESDYWLEDGLLFQGIDLDKDANRSVSLEIMLRGQVGRTRNHMTHNITSVRRIDRRRAQARKRL